MSSTQTESRASRILRAAQQCTAAKQERDLISLLNSTRLINFVAEFSEECEFLWSPSLDAAMELICIANGPFQGQIEIRYPPYMFRDTKNVDIESTSKLVDSVSELLSALDHNPKSSHALIWHVPGERFVRCNSGPAINWGHALHSMADAINAHVEQWKYFEFPVNSMNQAR